MTKEPRFTTIVGVDQTGQKGTRPGTAKRLPACILTQIDDAHWQFRAEKISALSRDIVRDLQADAEPTGASQGTAIVVDCVIGLPATHWPSRPSADALWTIMRQTHNFAGFGLDAASAFFRTIDRLESPGGLRRCEEITDAQSVFVSTPVQRNIQTGTFRIWKDLTASGKSRWLYLWPFEQPTVRAKHPVWLFEVYPSLIWRALFDGTRRDTTRLPAIIKQFGELGITVKVSRKDIGLLIKDTDLADAAVSALGALKLQQENRLWEPDRRFRRISIARREGWLIGLPSPPPE